MMALWIAFSHRPEQPVRRACEARADCSASSNPAPSAFMGASLWFNAQPLSLPLIHLPVDACGVLLPGESRRILIEREDDLAALNEMQFACVGVLPTTPHCAGVSTLLNVRETRRQEVGALIEVVSVGRIHASQIEHDRCFTAHARPAFDGRAEPDIDIRKLVAELRSTAEQHDTIRRKLRSTPLPVRLPGSFLSDEVGTLSGMVVPTGRGTHPGSWLEQECARMREELCVTDLDAAPAASLERLHALWGVPDEESAELLLLSFAACASLTATQRALACGTLDTAERLRYARRCLLEGTKRMVAQAAIRDALEGVL